MFCEALKEISVAKLCPGSVGVPYRDLAQAGSELAASKASEAQAGAAGVANRTAVGRGGIVKNSAARFASSEAVSSGEISLK